MQRPLTESASPTDTKSSSKQEAAPLGRLDIIDEPPPAAKRYFYLLAGLLILSSLTLFFGINRLALIGPDEPRYAEVAREMFATGDYITPRLCGCPWFEKPALLYWMAAGAYHLFGVGEFAARFPAAFSALALALFLCFALWRCASPRFGLIVSLVLATSGLFIGYAHACNPDMLLTATMGLALVAGYMSTLESGRVRTGYWALCWAGIGAAMLAKGLIGIVLPVAIFGLYLLLSGRLSRTRWWHWPAGLAISVAVASVWYLPVTLSNGWDFINEFFIKHHFRRYLTNEYGHPQPVYFYLFIVFAGALPWTFFLIPALGRLRALAPRKCERDSLLLLAWLWVAVPLVFFSFSRSKLPGYILPVFPAMAIILGVEVERFWQGERSKSLKAGAGLTALMLILIGAAFIWYLKKEAINPTGLENALCWLPLAVGLIAAAMLVSARRRAFVVGTTVVISSLIFSSSILLFPALENELSLKSLSLQAAAALQPGEKIAFYVKKEFAPVFYAEGRVVCGVGDDNVLNALDPTLLAEALQVHPGLIVITPTRWVIDLKNDKRFETELIGTQDDINAIRLRLKPKD